MTNMNETVAPSEKLNAHSDHEKLDASIKVTAHAIKSLIDIFHPIAIKNRPSHAKILNIIAQCLGFKTHTGFLSRQPNIDAPSFDRNILQRETPIENGASLAIFTHLFLDEITPSTYKLKLEHSAAAILISKFTITEEFNFACNDYIFNKYIFGYNSSNKQYNPKLHETLISLVVASHLIEYHGRHALDVTPQIFKGPKILRADLLNYLIELTPNSEGLLEAKNGNVYLTQEARHYMTYKYAAQIIRKSANAQKIPTCSELLMATKVNFSKDPFANQSNKNLFLCDLLFMENIAKIRPKIDEDRVNDFRNITNYFVQSQIPEFFNFNTFLDTDYYEELKTQICSQLERKLEIDDKKFVVNSMGMLIYNDDRTVLIRVMNEFNEASKITSSIQDFCILYNLSRIHTEINNHIEHDPSNYNINLIYEESLPIIAKSIAHYNDKSRFEELMKKCLFTPTNISI